MRFLANLYKCFVFGMVFNITLEVIVVCFRPVDECKTFVSIQKSYLVMPGAWIACKIRTY